MLRKIVIGVVLAVIVNHVALLIYSMGFHKTIYKHQPGPCRYVTGLADMGSEDITVTSTGLAFISSGELSRQDMSIDPARLPPHIKGRIYLFDFNNPEKDAVELDLIGDFERKHFYPHGISIYEDSDLGELRIFAVNHHISGKDRIEIFKYDEKKRSLNHLKTVMGKTIYSVNDVVAVGPESFYYTNDKYFVNKWGRVFEAMTRVAWGTVGFYDNGKDSIVATGLCFANGINISPDMRHVYVATTFGGEVFVYERKGDNSLKEIKQIKLYSGLDNIEVDMHTGDLWLGCHPVLHTLTEHMSNISNPGGSQVLRLRLGETVTQSSNVDITEVFVDDGSMINSQTVASYYEGKLLIGTLFGKTAFCEVKHA